MAKPHRTTQISPSLEAMDTASQGMFAEAERESAPSPALVAATVCAGPFCPLAMYTGPTAAAARRSTGAAERNPQDRRRRRATSFMDDFIDSVASIPRAEFERLRSAQSRKPAPDT